MFNFDVFKEFREEINALKKEIQKLKDAQVKQDRDYKDLFDNLDYENVPALNKGIIKYSSERIEENGDKSLGIDVRNKDEEGEHDISSSVIIQKNNVSLRVIEYGPDGGANVGVRFAPDKSSTAYMSANGVTLYVNKDGVFVVDGNGTHKLTY